MTKNEFIVTLSVKDIAKSKEFYKKLGFTFPKDDDNQPAIFFIGKMYVAIMLYNEPGFKEVTGKEILDTKQGNEVFFSFELESKQELYELANNVKQANGTILTEPYGSDEIISFHHFEFADLDGHRWHVSFTYVDVGVD